MGDEQIEIEAVYPLSPLQEGMLFHALRNPSGGDDVVQVWGQIALPLTPEIVCEAFAAAVARHPILRTGFSWRSGTQPLQVVTRSTSVPFEIADWRALDKQQAATEREKLLQKLRHHGFDLSCPPLISINAALLYDDIVELVVSFHHILLDGWSFAALLSEIGTQAHALARGEIPLLPPARRAFRDYIAWLETENREKTLSFWRSELTGINEPTLISLSRQPEMAKPRFEQEVLVLEGSEVAMLVQAAADNGLTLNTLTQGALALLIARYVDRQDAVFGTTVSGRSTELAGVNDMLGMLINTVPSRIRIDESAQVGDWLRDLQVRQLLARNHAFAPLSEIQNSVDIPSNVSLFDCVYVFENFPAQNQETAHGLFAGVVHSREQTGYPITLTLQPGETLRIELDYDAVLLPANRARSMLSHFRHMLKSLAQQPDRRLSRIELLSATEGADLLKCSAGPERPEDITDLYPLLERHALANPEKVAIDSPDGSLEYATLHAEVGAFVDRLQKLSLGCEDAIAVRLERGRDHGVAVLGILTAGAAYMPLDLRWPLRRCAKGCAEAGLSALVTRTALMHESPPGPWPVVLLDDSSIKASRRRHRPASSPATALGYLALTSGTSGHPKAAMVERRGLFNHLEMMVETLALGPADVVAQTASISFDVAIWQLLAPIVVGAQCVVVADAMAHDGPELLAHVAEKGITVLQTVPSILAEMVACCAPPEKALRVVISTGEALPTQLARDVMEHWPGVRLFNAYGPAEAADDTMLVELTANMLDNRSTGAPIGPPARNTIAYVLDGIGRLRPAELAGELWLAGAGLGRGYAANPRQTAAAFRPDPFTQIEGGRIYGTGDRVRWRDDHALDYLGRLDHQIKLHGVRIEPGDIEATLETHPAIKRAVVAVTGEGDRRRLVAWIQAESAPDDLHGFVRNQLPLAMVPSQIITLNAFPLTTNGKLDRTALNALVPSGVITKGEKTSARPSPTEDALSNIWVQVLGVHSIGRDDDFFACGGHSLLAMRLIARSCQAIGRDIPVSTLFDAPTPRQFAEAVVALSRSNASPPPPLTRTTTGLDTPASSGQLRLWRIVVDNPGIALFNLPVRLRLTGDLDTRALEVAIGDVVARHEALRTRLLTQEDRLIQRVDPPTEFSLLVIDLTAAGSEVIQCATALAAEEAQWPFLPFQESCFRAALLRLGIDDHLLMLTTNHLVADDLSLGIILEDISAAYEARREGSATPPPHEIQFADFAAWRMTLLDSGEAKRQANYWRKKLHGLSPRLDLPATQSRGEQPGSRFRRVRRVLSAELSAAIDETARRLGVTVFVLSASAFGAFLGLRSKQRDVRFATLVSTRRHAETESMVGPLIGTVILRAKLIESERFSRWVGRLQRTTIETFANIEIPIEEVVAAAAPERDLKSAPLSQAMLIFQRPLEGKLSFSDLEAEPLGPVISSAQEPVQDEYEVTSFEIICEVEARAERTVLILRYDADLFDEVLASQYLNDLEAILSTITRNTSTTVGALLRGAYDAPHEFL